MCLALLLSSVSVKFEMNAFVFACISRAVHFFVQAHDLQEWSYSSSEREDRMVYAYPHAQ